MRIFPYTKYEDGTICLGKYTLVYSKPFWFQWDAYRKVLGGLWNFYIRRPYNVMQGQHFAVSWWNYTIGELRYNRKRFKEQRIKHGY